MLLGTQNTISHSATPHLVRTVLTYPSRKATVLSKHESQLMRRRLDAGFALRVLLLQGHF